MVSRSGSARWSDLLSHVAYAAQPRERIEVRGPCTGEIFASVPAATAADVRQAVDAARSALPAWQALPHRRRAAIFLRFHDLLLDRQEQGLDLIQLEAGKARRHAFEEILDTAIVTRYYAHRAGRILRPRRRNGALPFLTRTLELRTPVGVVGIVSPWNYPLNLAITDAVPALLAGNAAVLMPDRQTTLTALWAVSLLREAGLPPAIFPVLTGDGREVGPWLGDLADYLMFTGSTATGRIVAGQAAVRLIPCSLELGGKNPMLVLEDADLDAAVEGAVRGCFVGAGQVCVSIERLYVHASLFDAFRDRLVQRTRHLKLGAARDFAIEMGSLTSERQLNTVEEHVRDALSQGAVLLAGGKRRPDLGPLFYSPTILAGVREGMRMFAEETFGPVVALYSFETDEEAVALANASPYGLSASLWTRNRGRALRLAARIQAGNVNVNEAYAAAWGSVDSPCGGIKQSGLHPRHGAEGILKFTNSRTVASQRWIPIAPVPWMRPELWAAWMSRMLRLLRRLPRFLGF